MASPSDPEFLASHGMSTSPHFIDLPQFEGRKPTIGVCAMDSKARSKAMTNILNRLHATNRYTVVFFTEKTILDEDIEKWPLCDFLISFFSAGFPLEKALQYTRLRKPFSVNSLVRQFLLFDRRIVLEMLGHAGVPTPRHLVVSRDGGPQVHPLLQRVVEQRMGLTLGQSCSGGPVEVEQVDEDTLRIGSQIIKKPFVEKPVDAEDHNIYIYYSSAQGGGVRRLFRKIGNKSSEFHPGPSTVRTDGSYIYEEFIDVDNAVDVKVYTVGQEYAHAETRKSPVVDGHVRRNTDGKEMRFVTQLSPQEREYARLVSSAFGQRVCGFDILRASDGRSLVMDVNGWSFVKGNEEYYAAAARILDSRFQEALRHRWFARFVDPEEVGRLTYESRWVLKGVMNVCRHADRTPKQKMKAVLEAPHIVGLLDGARAEVVFRSQIQLQRALDALHQAAAADPSQDLHQLIDILHRKIEMPGTKVQLKPLAKTLPAVQFILKWGGECTHAGIVQAQDVGETMRKDLLLINPGLLDDVQVFCSAERRVHSTLTAYMGAFFNNSDFAHRVTVRSDMLDDSALAKAGMEAVRMRIRGLFNFDGPLEYNPYYDPEFMRLDDMGSDPKAFLRSMCSVMSRLVARMEQNFSDLGSAQLAELQPEWCCNENAELFRERWKKIMDDFQSTDKQGNIIYDPAKVGAVYDSLKYDALHNRRFLERIFMTPGDLATEIQNMAAQGESAANTDEAKAVEYSNHSDVDELDEDAGAGRLAQLDIAGNVEDDESVSDDFIEISSNTDPIDIPQRSIQHHRNSPAVGSPATAQTLHSHNAPPIYPPDPLFTQKEVRQLYHKARQLFDFVTPLEFGIQPQERRRIGIQASIPLLRQLILDLQSIRTGPNPRTRFYFTKESHMHTLLNLVFICGLPTVVPYAEVGELDYLTHVIFEVYERKSDVDANLEGEYSLRVGFSPGASCVGVLDINVDSTHALKVLPRKNFTQHVPLDTAIQALQALLEDEACADINSEDGGWNVSD